MDDYRLTEADERTIVSAMRRHHADPANGRGRTLDQQVSDLAMAGRQAIGCTFHDLRDCEVQWMENEAGETVYGITP